MPDWTAEIRDRLAELKLEPTREAEITEELSQHLDDRFRDASDGGAPESEARAMALAELADPRVLAALLRATERRGPPTDPTFGAPNRGAGLGLAGDIRHAFRTLRRSPAFAAVAVISLALGSGANAAVFRLLDAVRLRNLPVQAPQELVDIMVTDRKGLSGSFNGLHPEFSYGLWERIRDRQEGLSGVYAWSTGQFNLAEGGEVRYAQGLWVTGDFFRTLGVLPEKGRLFQASDDVPGCPANAVVSHTFWQRELSGDPGVLDRTVLLDNVRVPIVGVTPAPFFGVEVGRRFDVAVLTCAEPILREGRNYLGRLDAWWLAIGGRLAPGSSIERVTTQLRAISPAIFRETTPASYGPEPTKAFQGCHLGAQAGGTGRSSLRRVYASPLLFLLGIGGLVLLIACANVANLLLARASNREREIAARLALGASRARVLRHLLVESFVIAALGVGLGVVLSQALTHYLVATLTTTDNPLYIDLAPNARFFGLTVVLAVITCLVFGLGPAIRCTRVPPAGIMRATGRGLTAGRRRLRVQRGLVVGQVALSMVLLIAALLFLESFRNLVTDSPGFRTSGVVVAELDLSRLAGGDERQREVGRQILERLRATPGVEAAAASNVVPLENWWNEDVLFKAQDGKEQHGLVNFSAVSEGYFKTLEIPQLAGRDFGTEDRPGSPKTTVVNQALVKKHFGNESPLGRTIEVVQAPGKPNLVYQIVGIVGDTKYQTLKDNFEPIAYIPTSQHSEVSYTNLFVHGAAPNILLPTVRTVVSTIDPVIVMQLSVLATKARQGATQERIMATLSGYFGGLALILATIGLYGVLAYLVARRTSEMGLRMALGADRQTIIRMIVGESLGLVVGGLVLGTVLTIIAIKLSSVALFGLKPGDPAVFATGVLTLTGSALLAGYLPGRRAARVDPMEALRAE